MLLSHKTEAGSKPHARTASADTHEGESKDWQEETGCSPLWWGCFFKCIYMCVKVYYVTRGVQVREPPVEAGSYPRGSWDQIQATRFSGKHLYTLSHHTGLFVYSIKSRCSHPLMYGFKSRIRNKHKEDPLRKTNG